VSNLRLIESRTHIIAVEGDRVTGTIGVSLQPGRVGLVFPPELDRAAGDVVDRLIDAAIRRLSRTGAAFIELVLDPNDESVAAPFLRAGFQHLTDAVLLEKRLDRTVAKAPSSALEATAVEPGSERGRLTDLIRCINSGSLDCPELDAWRTPTDLLEAHHNHSLGGRARWWRYAADGVDVGLVIGTVAEDDEAWEILFLGVVPEQRGKSFGRRMLDHFHAQAAQESHFVRVGVDSRNTYAQELYNGCSYRQTGRLRVWIHPPLKTA
jgi:ribosomal protein S18 acetylase RimI-like enzyme